MRFEVNTSKFFLAIFNCLVVFTDRSDAEILKFLAIFKCADRQQTTTDDRQN